MRWVLRLLVNGAALWVATQIVPGIEHSGGWVNFLLVALVFGLVNTFVRPFVKLISCGLLVVTLGLFIFVVNAAMLWLTGYLSDSLGLGFRVDGFVPAFLGALVVGVVSFVLSWFLPDEERVAKPRPEKH
jgi:putative membrane protein